MKKVAFHTLGCKVNQYETEAMEELFEKANYSIVRDEEFAHIYVINTCTVTNLSDRKSRQFIRRVRRINKDATIAVVGCYSQISPEEISKIEGVDVILGTSQRNRIVELCEEAEKKNRQINIVESARSYQEFEEISVEDIKSKTRAYIKIQDGCNQYCSYCIIPFARGPIRSRRLEDTMVEIEKLADSGFKEIVLTGIHVASYGKDLGDINLDQAIKKISTIAGIERIRLSSVEPNIVDDEFMTTIVETGKACDHFHLSLQSGSDKILRRMNRKYTCNSFKEKVELIRKYMPDAGITTDIIVGFPGETDKDFEETLDFVKDIGFSRIHVFKYSPREGTAAARFKEQVNGKVKNERSRILIHLADQLSREFNSRFINSHMEVLYEVEDENNPGVFEGYTSNYIRVKTKSDEDLVGQILRTQIVDSKGDILIGKLI
ncbi:MAG TPA: tRNA (N(6)-L-threonylcarbamoyladenosine(37)-C(2))-methylthiotransferase MtaB [Tissierellaceae bacterium]|nr:tRNA (N(6)-L-threonylcarbamoyladenosine(37)-C(2))-methylthiotransferase MtaB [Tissierellaceae bacterium]